jgi:hypothetical protein
MFIETYYDDRTAVPGSLSEPMIPYPELSGEALTVWQEYLPIKRPIRNLYSPFNTIPDPAIAEIKKATRSFDRIEIWSRAADPMAVGVIGEEKPRYFSIVRWGGCGTHARAGKKETVGREMAALVDSDRGDLEFSRCRVGCRGPWWIEVLFYPLLLLDETHSGFLCNLIVGELLKTR